MMEIIGQEMGVALSAGLKGAGHALKSLLLVFVFLSAEMELLSFLRVATMDIDSLMMAVTNFAKFKKVGPAQQVPSEEPDQSVQLKIRAETESYKFISLSNAMIKTGYLLMDVEIAGCKEVGFARSTPLQIFHNVEKYRFVVMKYKKKESNVMMVTILTMMDVLITAKSSQKCVEMQSFS